MNQNTIKTTYTIEPHTKLIHDFKSPLNLILSSADMIRLKVNTTPLDIESVLQYVHYIDQNCHRLVRLTESLLSLSPTASSSPVLQTSPCDIISFTECIVHDLLPYIEQYNMEFHVDFDLPRPCVLNFDRDLIERMLWNLMINAAKHTPHGGTLTLRLCCDADFVYLSVIDSGEGISHFLKERIFEPHITDGYTLGASFPSHGFGLTIVRELAELHKGSISATSIEDGGTDFTFSLSRHLPITLGNPPVSGF